MYFDKGLTFHYDADFLLEAIEIFTPESAMLNGINILSLTSSQAGAMLARLDPNTRVEFNGSTAYDLSLQSWTEDPDDLGEDAPIENFMFGVAGVFGDPDEDFSHMDVWELADGLGEVAQQFVQEYFGERPDPTADEERD